MNKKYENISGNWNEREILKRVNIKTVKGWYENSNAIMHKIWYTFVKIKYWRSTLYEIPKAYSPGINMRDDIWNFNINANDDACYHHGIIQNYFTKRTGNIKNNFKNKKAFKETKTALNIFFTGST